MTLLLLLASVASAMSVRQTSLRVSGMPEAPALALGRLLADPGLAASVPDLDPALARLQEQLARRPDLDLRESPAANLLYSVIGEGGFGGAMAEPAGVRELGRAAREVREAALEESRLARESLSRSEPGARAALARALGRYSMFLTQAEIEELSGLAAGGLRPEHRLFVSRTASAGRAFLDMEPEDVEALFSAPQGNLSEPSVTAGLASGPAAPAFGEILYPAALADVSSLRALAGLFPAAKVEYNDALMPSEATVTRDWVTANKKSDLSRLRDQVRLLRTLFFSHSAGGPLNIAHEVLDAASRTVRFLFRFGPREAPRPGMELVEFRYRIGRMEDIERRYPAVFVHYPGYAGFLSLHQPFWETVLHLIEPRGHLLVSRFVYEMVSRRPAPEPPRFSDQDHRSPKKAGLGHFLMEAFEPGLALQVPGAAPGPSKSTVVNEVLVFKKRDR